MPKTQEQLFEEAERALVGEAIAETEQEIADSAFDLEPDDNDGDTSLEQIDEDDVLDDDGIEEEEDAEQEVEEGETEAEEVAPESRADDRPQDRRGIPPARLREEAEARRVAEAERGRFEAENRELRARMDALERGQQRPTSQQQTQQTQQNEPPDIFADPEGRLAWERNQIAQQFETRRINSSFDDARDQHGERFVAAFQDLQRTQNPNLVSEIVGSNNPGRALMNWHGRQTLLSEIGNDPAAYRERVRQEMLADPEIRKAVISGARTDALRGDGGAPRTQTRLPPSLNSATGGTSHRSGSRDTARTNRSIEQEIADSAWDD